MKKQLVGACLVGLTCAFAQGQDTETGLINYWSLDGSESDIVGTTTSTFAGDADWNLGKYGYANTFDGSSYIATDYAPAIPAGGSFTCSTWFRHTNEPDAVYRLIGLERSGGQEISIHLNGNNDKLVAYFRDDNWNAVYATAPWAATSDGEWHHVAAVLDGDAGTVTLYLDGVAHETTSGTLGDLNVNAPMTMAVGCDNNSNSGYIDRFPGSLDDVRFYDRALTAEDVRQLAPHTCRGDFNADGEINTLDVLAFLNAWTAGCP